MLSLEDVLEAAREGIANDNTDRLVSELEFDEDLVNYGAMGDRAFGPDKDEE